MRPLGPTRRRLDGEKVAGAGVRRGVPQLRHCPRLDLADAFAGEVKVLANLFESAGFATIKTEPELEDLAFPLVERSEESVDLVGQQRRGGDFKW
jgi:hypothetical protein